MFRRRRNDELDQYPDGNDVDNEADGPGGDPATTPTMTARRRGPWDEADAPADAVNRLDLGALLVPVTDGLELRVDVDPATNQVVSVTLTTPTSAMQIGAFAAPRTAGIWAEVRAEIAASLATAGSGGSSAEVAGPFGPELRAQVPTDVPGQSMPARFVGVDGPRWFLRAMLQGQAAIDPAADPALLAAFGDLIVVRGTDAMVVRDPLLLRLPADLTAPGAAGPDQPVDAPPPSLALPERGPEITETR